MYSATTTLAVIAREFTVMHVCMVGGRAIADYCCMNVRIMDAKMIPGLWHRIWARFCSFDWRAAFICWPRRLLKPLSFVACIWITSLLSLCIIFVFFSYVLPYCAFWKSDKFIFCYRLSDFFFHRFLFISARQFQNGENCQCQPFHAAWSCVYVCVSVDGCWRACASCMLCTGPV